MRAFLFLFCFFLHFPLGALDLNPPQNAFIFKEDLPYKARQKLKAIEKGAPFSIREDNTVFHNLPPRLPEAPRGFYRLFIVENAPGEAHKDWRIVQGGTKFYFSPDHLRTFFLIRDAR